MKKVTLILVILISTIVPYQKTNAQSTNITNTFTSGLTFLGYFNAGQLDVGTFSINPINFFFNDLTPEQYEEIMKIAANSNQAFD